MDFIYPQQELARHRKWRGPIMERDICQDLAAIRFTVSGYYLRPVKRSLRSMG